jgi:hypothetical protein
MFWPFLEGSIDMNWARTKTGNWPDKPNYPPVKRVWHIRRIHDGEVALCGARLLVEPILIGGTDIVRVPASLVETQHGDVHPEPACGNCRDLIGLMQ